MATFKTHWTWADKECFIQGKTLEVHDTDGDRFGGGASCHLRDFLRGELTWLLPDKVRREALATAQAILKVRGPLRNAVRRGDFASLVPAARLARMRERREQRARDAESARLATPVETADLPDAQCTVCKGLMDQYLDNRREFERVIRSAFPHDKHQPALRAVERRLEELRAGMKDPGACESCRRVASPIRATHRQPLPPEAQSIVALPALFHTPGSVCSDAFVRCAECGSVWNVAYFHEENDDTEDSTTRYLQLANLDSIRYGLESLLHRGDVPDWVAAVMEGDRPAEA